jgi:hypothetical protein
MLRICFIKCFTFLIQVFISVAMYFAMNIQFPLKIFVSIVNLSDVFTFLEFLKEFFAL